MTKEEILKKEIEDAEYDIKFYSERLKETEKKYNEDQEWNREHLEKAKLLLEILKREQENY